MRQPEDREEMREQRTREFVHLMSVSQMKIYVYIMSMVGNSSDADDIMQNTSAFMWERYSEFEPGTDFVRWGISIAYYKVKEFRNQQNRHQFSDAVLEKLHHNAPGHLNDLNLYIEKLHHCLAKLPPADLDVVKLRYESGQSVKKISIRINKTAQAVYLRLSKIHDMLSRCIRLLIVQESL